MDRNHLPNPPHIAFVDWIETVNRERRSLRDCHDSSENQWRRQQFFVKVRDALDSGRVILTFGRDTMPEDNSDDTGRYARLRGGSEPQAGGRDFTYQPFSIDAQRAADDIEEFFMTGLARGVNLNRNR
jgi:hypothetical protein